MYAIDFEYDGQFLSDYGFIICDFNSPSLNTTSAGSTITFNRVSTHSGKLYNLTSTRYDECIQATFSICKNPKFGKDNMRITNDEYRDLFRWLNRREFKTFRLLGNEDKDGQTCFYDASFNLDKIEIAGYLCGLELTMETNRPFGYGEEQVFELEITDTSAEYNVIDFSDEIGSLYPSMTITINADGNLSLSNQKENCTMVINNCKRGEVIEIDGDSQIITTSLVSHKIYNDFNFEFFRISNTFDERDNDITCSLECDIELRYFPIIKGSI